MGFKYNIIKWYIEQRNRFGSGQAFFGFFAGLINFYVLAQVYVNLILKKTLPQYYYIVGAVVLVFCYWAFGLIWDKKGCFVIENEFGNERNAVMIEMRKRFNLPVPNGKDETGKKDRKRV